MNLQKKLYFFLGRTYIGDVMTSVKLFITPIFVSLLVLGCGKKEHSPTGLAAADIAGIWELKSVISNYTMLEIIPQNNDTIPHTYLSTILYSTGMAQDTTVRDSLSLSGTCSRWQSPGRMIQKGTWSIVDSTLTFTLEDDRRYGKVSLSPDQLIFTEVYINRIDSIYNSSIVPPRLDFIKIYNGTRQSAYVKTTLFLGL